VSSAAFSTDGSRIVTASWDKTATTGTVFPLYISVLIVAGAAYVVANGSKRQLRPLSDRERVSLFGKPMRRAISR
jgi:hypothetical protein